MQVDTLASSVKWAMQPALVLDRVPRNVYLKGRRTSTSCTHSTEDGDQEKTHSLNGEGKGWSGLVHGEECRNGKDELKEDDDME